MIGDIVICLDSSRLGRAMLKSAGVVCELVNEKGARLFYASSGEEVTARNAIEQFMIVAQGFGAQQEKELNQQRTRDALREKVRRGEIAGGRCFGYQNVQEPRMSSGGRATMNTRAIIDEAQAKVVRRIFALYLSGHGLTRIAKALNRERVPPPFAGTKRGTGSWSPSCIREMLRRERYRGMYVHGKIKRTRKGGRRVATVADPSEIIRVEMPEWRIVDDETWWKVQQEIAERARHSLAPGPATKYALSGIARCDHCGGAICLASTKRSGGVRVRAYTCSWHVKRGSVVCPVKVRQPQDEVEGALANYIQGAVLTPVLIEAAVAEVRKEVERKLAKPAADTSAIEAELRAMRFQQKKLAKAVALADDIPELVTELRTRQDRVRALEADLAAAKRTPKMLANLMAQVEDAARTKLADMRATLAADPDGARDVYRALFPQGLAFKPTKKGTRHNWQIEGTAKLGGCNLDGDPTGNWLYVVLNMTMVAAA